MDWINHYHDAIEALASVSSFFVALAAVFVAWRAPAIAANYAKREYTKEVEDRTRSLVANLNRAVATVAAEARTRRDRLFAQKIDPPSEAIWTAFCESLQFSAMPPALAYYYQFNDVDQLQIAPYAEFVQLVIAYNNQRLNTQYSEKSLALSDWPAYWGQLHDKLNAIIAASRKLLDQENDGD